MTPADRAFALKGLDISREHLVRVVHGLSHEQLEYRPAADRWSVAENLEHVIVSERYVLGRVKGLVQEAPDSSRQSHWEGRDEPLVRTVAERGVDRGQAPDAFLPIGRWPIEQLVPEFEAARALSRAFVASTREDLRRHFFRHPVLGGELDGVQWLLLIGAHCYRHGKQSEEVIASPGFPRHAERAAAPRPAERELHPV